MPAFRAVQGVSNCDARIGRVPKSTCTSCRQPRWSGILAIGRPVEPDRSEETGTVIRRLREELGCIAWRMAGAPWSWIHRTSVPRAGNTFVSRTCPVQGRTGLPVAPLSGRHGSPPVRARTEQIGSKLWVIFHIAIVLGVDPGATGFIRARSPSATGRLKPLERFDARRRSASGGEVRQERKPRELF